MQDSIQQVCDITGCSRISAIAALHMSQGVVNEATSKCIDSEAQVLQHETEVGSEALEAWSMGPLPMSRVVSVESQGSQGSANFYDDEEDFYGDGDSPFMDAGPQLDATLREHLDNAACQLGPDCIIYSNDPARFATLTSMPVLLNVSPLCLTKATCLGWGIDRSLPISLEFSVSWQHYLHSSTRPKVKCFQGVKSNAFKTSHQIMNLISNFLDAAWAAREANQGGAGGAGDTGVAGSGAFAAAAYASSDSMEVTPEVEALVDMGFSRPLVESALAETGGDREAAVTKLVSGFGTETDSGGDSGGGRAAAFLERTARKGKEPELAAAGSKGKQSWLAAAIFSSTKSVAKASHRAQKKAKSGLFDGDDDGNTWTAASVACVAAAAVLPDGAGLFVVLHQYLTERLAGLNKYCPICDLTHTFGNMLKPAICERSLCTFAFQQLGLMAEEVGGVATSSAVVDLLVAMASKAVKSARKEQIFDPFPQIIDPVSRIEVFGNQNKDYAAVEAILDLFPTHASMMDSANSNALAERLDATHKYAKSLLEWLLESNRSHIVQIPSDALLKSVPTDHQYLMMSAPPEKEAKFDALRKQHGSTFVWHGSSIENFHAIIRSGLRNLSNTKLMTAGAAHGAGIYLSPASATSIGYSTRHGAGAAGAGAGKAKPAANGNTYLSDSDNLICLILCEVIEHPTLRKNGDIWVAPDEDTVVTRFFFVFAGSSRLNWQQMQVRTLDSTFQDEVKQAITVMGVGVDT